MKPILDEHETSIGDKVMMLGIECEVVGQYWSRSGCCRISIKTPEGKVCNCYEYKVTLVNKESS